MFAFVTKRDGKKLTTNRHIAINTIPSIVDNQRPILEATGPNIFVPSEYDILAGRNARPETSKYIKYDKE